MEDNLKGELSCPVCMELFSRPLRLACGHSYCRNCLLAMAKRSVPGAICCPECRRVFHIPSTGVDSFPVDFKLSKLVDVFKKMEETYGTGAEQTTQNSNVDSTAKERGVIADHVSITRQDEENEPDRLTDASSNPRGTTDDSAATSDRPGNSPTDITAADDITGDLRQTSFLSSGTNLQDTETRPNESETSGGRRLAGESDDTGTVPSELELSRRRPPSVESDGFVVVPNEPESSRIRRPARVVTQHSDDSDDDNSGPRDQPGGLGRRRRKNKVLRFFSSLLSLSSSDDEGWGSSSSSSSDSNIYRLPEKNLPPLSDVRSDHTAVPSADGAAVDIDRETSFGGRRPANTDRTTGRQGGLTINPAGSENGNRNSPNVSRDVLTSGGNTGSAGDIETAAVSNVSAVRADVESGSECTTSGAVPDTFSSPGNVGTSTCGLAATCSGVPGHIAGEGVNSNNDMIRGVKPVASFSGLRTAATASELSDIASRGTIAAEREISNSEANVASATPSVSFVHSTQTHPIAGSVAAAADTTGGSQQDVMASSMPISSQQRTARRVVHTKKKKKRSLFSFFNSSSSSLSEEEIRKAYGSDDDLLTDHTGSRLRMPPRQDDDDDGLIQ
ncbi:uncharacterized protein LOC121377266 [Gigantopelta aegis]|uniref:uncharacterized protein LOC121377266 n=1 Tax=Gigantopelta aegis TaxID=1735272 RepID=UPI001B88A6F5|nr:uncharacterized protein LOC121377266 [Gigantopelta aegis]